jgi:hypothetical protein
MTPTSSPLAAPREQSLEGKRNELRGVLYELDRAFQAAWKRTLLPNSRLGIELNRLRTLARNPAFDAAPANAVSAIPAVSQVIAQVRAGIATFEAYAAATDTQIAHMAYAGTIVVGSDPQRDVRERDVAVLCRMGEASRPKYSPAELVVALANRGIKVQATLDGKLLVEAAPGVLTAADRDLLRTQKAAVVQALNSRVEVF